MEERESRRKLLQFLLGLHDSFSNARGQILMMQPLPDVNHAYSLIKQDERQRQGFMTEHNSNSFLVGNNSANMTNRSYNANYGNSYGFAGKQQMHQSTYNKMFSTNMSGGLKCTNYGRTNHTVDNCFQIVGFPPDHPRHQANRGKTRSFDQGTQST